MKKLFIFSLSLLMGFILTGVVYADKGNVFYYENFSNVKVGHLPRGWVGGEKLLVKAKRGKKFLTAFERGEHSVTIPNINYPKNYEIRVIGFYSGYVDEFHFSMGSANFGTEDTCCWLNKSKVKFKERIQNKTFTLVFKKEGPVLSVQVSGNEPVIVRDPHFKSSDTFTLGFNIKDSMIYEIKMKDIGN